MFKKIVQLGWQQCSRDKSSFGAAFVVATIVIVIATFLFFMHGISSFLIYTIENSVDVSAYFKPYAQEQDILKLKDSLLKMPEVKDVAYVSKDDALKAFVALHKNDQIILDSLDTIGDNPLLASLNIHAKDPSQYKAIADAISQSSSNPLISKVDYQERAPVIEKLTSIASGIQWVAFLLSVVFAGIACLVGFNTIRLAIANAKDEIEVMRLVGASNWFIRGPFLVQGVIVGLAGSLCVLVVLIPATLFLDPFLRSFLSGFSLTHYFLSNILLILLLELVVGIGIGVVSSMLAIRRYLKI